MKGPERREQILKLLQNTSTPISGRTIASKFNVSRQVIVQDMALLRAGNHNIMATTKGYLYLN